MCGLAQCFLRYGEDILRVSENLATYLMASILVNQQNVSLYLYAERRSAIIRVGGYGGTCHAGHASNQNVLSFF